MNERLQNNAADVLKYTGIFVIVLIVFVAVLSINALKSFGYIGENEETTDTLVVRGEGEVFAVPDIATFSYSVVEQGDTVGDAQEQATEKWNEILAYLEGEGVEEEDVKTVGFNVSPVYAPRTDTSASEFRVPQPDVAREIVGYTVRQTAQVKVRDTENVGSLLSGVGSRDVQNLSGLSFTIEDEEAIRAEARAAAIENAEEKAGDLADALGVRLDGVVGFNEGGYSPYARSDSAMMSLEMEQGDDGMASAPSIPMGENRVLVNVEVTYRIR